MNRLPYVTKNLLAINILMFLATVVMERQGTNLTSLFGLHFFMASDFAPYQLVTYMFMHGGFSHLFFNMFALYMFGGLLERVWGSNRFLVFYMVCGVGAGLLQEAVQYVEYVQLGLNDMTFVPIKANTYMPVDIYLNLRYTTVGASGAIYGILLGFAMSFPNEKMFVFPLPFPIKAKFFVLGYAVIELLLGVANTNDGVAHYAHLGGMLFGVVLILYWRKKHKIGGPYV